MYFHAGGVSTLEQLNTAGTDYLKTGIAAGGGLRWLLGDDLPGLSLRGEVTSVRSELRSPRVGSGTRINLLFYGVDLGCTCLSTGHFVSDFFAGGGGVSIHPAASGEATRTKPFLRFGVNLRYGLVSRLQLFAQGDALVFHLDGFPSTSVLGRYHHRQVDLAYTAGVAFRF